MNRHSLPRLAVLAAAVASAAVLTASRHPVERPDATGLDYLDPPVSKPADGRMS
jgi:hypothetical protein